LIAPPPRWRARAPIGLQLVALLLASLLAAQLITFAMIAVMPPPRPQIYRAFEIAAALKGGAMTPRLGRPLVRTLEPQLPAAFAHPDPLVGARSAIALAAELGVPAADVRLLTHEHRAPWERPRGMRGPRPPGPPASQWSVQGGREPFSGPRFVAGRWPAADIPIFGDVEAAVRRPSGDWVVVRSQPEAFPTEWERRILIWLAAGFLLVAPAGFLFARRITAPLKKFSEAADRLGRDPTAPPLTLSGPAEIGLRF
jgi:hypothetical protein